jgi:hypothetical protein
MRGLERFAVLLALVVTCAVASHAQDVAEAAAATSNSGVAASSIKMPPFTTTMPNTPPGPMAGPSNGSGGSAYMIAPSGPPADVVNRKDLEDNAGPNPGKLMLRSLPSGADIFVNERLVGRTPLLLVVAPGKYTIRMRGERQDTGSQTVGLMPKETQTVVITLKERYPSSIRIQ